MRKFLRHNSLVLIICFVLISVLTLSVVSITGAYFTYSTQAGPDNAINLRFGSVALDDTIIFGTDNISAATQSQTQTVSNLMPTQTVDYIGIGTGTSNNIKYDGTVDAYYRISFSISDVKNSSDVAIDSPTTAQIKALFSFTNGTFLSASQDKFYGLVTVASPEIPQGSLTFSKNAGNDFSNIKFTITITIDLIQVANLSAISGVGSMTTLQNYEALFGYYDTNLHS